MEGVQHDFEVPEHDEDSHELVERDEGSHELVEHDEGSHEVVEPDEGSHEVDGDVEVLVEHLAGFAEHGVESVEGGGIFVELDFVGGLSLVDLMIGAVFL